MAAVGLGESVFDTAGVSLRADDPLGVQSISGATAPGPFDPGSRASEDSARITRTLGEQAALLPSAHDRALAMRRISVAAQIHLSRRLVLGLISGLCAVGCSPGDISDRLRLFGLDDVTLLVNLMRLVAAGRAGSAEVSGNTHEPSTCAGDLRNLSRVLSGLLWGDRQAARHLMDVSVTDLMDAATGEPARRAAQRHPVLTRNDHLVVPAREGSGRSGGSAPAS